jgi:endonuclease/exonuclease/phosphatase family metal-dependent hydrolase
VARRRWIWKVLGLLLVARLAWYGTSRWQARHDVVRVFGEAPAAPPGDEALRLGVYNIAHGRGTAETNWQGGDKATRAARLEAIGALIAGADLDVVVLNEVDFQATWSHEVNQAEVLARAAGYPAWIEQRNVDISLPLSVYRFGNAVLSRYPIVSAEAVDYPSYSWVEALLGGKKTGLLVTLQVGERRLRVLAVHLEHRSARVRVATARRVLELAEGAPLVLAGDFNSAPPGFPLAEVDEEGFSALQVFRGAGWRGPPEGTPGPGDLTFPSTGPDRVLDWVLVPEGLRVAEKQVPQVTLSDHLPVWTTLEWE